MPDLCLAQAIKQSVVFAVARVPCIEAAVGLAVRAFKVVFTFSRSRRAAPFPCRASSVFFFSVSYRLKEWPVSHS